MVSSCTQGSIHLAGGSRNSEGHAIMESGALSVMTVGAVQMLTLSVDSWDTHQVCLDLKTLFKTVIRK